MNICVFLKGSKKSELSLKQSHPEIYQHLSDIWSVRQRHLVDGYPSQYVYFLRCCLDSTCIHPLCKRLVGSDLKQYKWFPGGPSVTTLPMPIGDLVRPWHGTCSDCKQFCAGHYLKPQEALHAGSTVTFNPPPSAVIQEASKAGILNESDIENLPRIVLLPVDVSLAKASHDRFKKLGAQKPAMTRRLKRASQHAQPSSELYYCGVCDELYIEADEEQDWIACDTCSTWYHWKCVHVIEEPESFV